MFCAVAQMSQLVFQPALDAFHAMFRLLRLRPILNVQHLSRDHVRILDFYLIFPFRIRTIRLAPTHQKFKKLAEKYAYLTPYGEQPDAPLLFRRMEPMQTAALETLAARSYIDLTALKSDEVEPTAQLVPREIAVRTEILNAEQADLIEFLRLLASDYELSGDNGLKARTGLLEHRYDAV
jgi:hypothetical protein